MTFLALGREASWYHIGLTTKTKSYPSHLGLSRLQGLSEWALRHRARALVPKVAVWLDVGSTDHHSVFGGAS